MNDYRSIGVYAGAATQIGKLLTLAGSLATDPAACVQVLCPPDAVTCQAAQRLLQAGGTQGTCEPVAEGADAPAQRSRGCDLLLLSQPYFDSAQSPNVGFASQLLVDASCPLLFVPRPQELGRQAGSAVLVAWDGGREGARAMRDALPLLQRARSVWVYAYGDPRGAGAQSLEAACGYLRRHGVEPRHALQRMGDADYGQRATMASTLLDAGVAELLLSDAAELGADLLVMGAYGHSRAQEWLLGGVTRSLLSSMTLPVLMSH